MMSVQDKIIRISKILDGITPMEINFIKENSADWKFLFCVMLTAQSTDKKVNAISPILFNTFKTLEDFANSDLTELEKILKPIGLYKNKAKNLKLCAIKLIELYNKKVPDNMDSLTSLPGVGRKTASCVLGHIYNSPAIIVDTHFARVCRRFGFTKSNNPLKIEKDISLLLPKEDWFRFSMVINLFGRTTCKAQNPLCQECCFREYCLVYKN